MKKVLCLIILIIIISSTCSFSVSDKFQNVLNVVGIDRYNISGYEINEYIYYVYNKIVYADPEKVINEQTQRWQDNDNGKWIRNGKKGEYRILGYDKNGRIVINDEYISEIINDPNSLKYIELADAELSWNNVNKCMFVNQKEYMQNSNLMLGNNKYNLNAIQIGLNKVRLENCATWQTKGIVYANYVDENNKEFGISFNTEPLGADVKLYNSVEHNGAGLTMFTTNNYINIGVEWKAGVESSSKYVIPEHVKLIQTSLYVNDGYVTTFSNSNVLNHGGNYYITMYRGEFPKYYYLKMHRIKITICTKLYTEFISDKPMYAINNIYVSAWIHDGIGKAYINRAKLDYNQFTENTYNIPTINNSDIPNINVGDNNEGDNGSGGDNSYNINIGRVVKENNVLKVEELYKTNSTRNAGSFGYIMAGNKMCIKIKGNDLYCVNMKLIGNNSIRNFDKKTKTFEYDEPKAKGLKTEYATLEEYYQLYSSEKHELQKVSEDTYIMQYLIPYATTQTLHSWNSIRDVNSTDSFKINKNLILSRIMNPYEIELNIYRQYEENTDGGKRLFTQVNKKYVKFDVWESWNNLYNRKFDNYLLNINREKLEYNDWIKK